MTRAEVRRQQVRVEKALAWAQKETRTSYCTLVAPMNAKQMAGGATFETGRSNRGTQDRGLFTVEFNPTETGAMKTRDLRRLAGHEVIHMILWTLGDAARESDVPGMADEEETCCYAIQRAIFGEVGE